MEPSRSQLNSNPKVTSLLYLNVRGLKLISNRNKPEQLCDIMKLENSIAIALTETWLKPNILDAEIYIEGYQVFRSDRDNRSHSGAIMMH